MTTLFTKIIDGAIPGRFVWADDLVVAFLTIEPITDGHTLVVPRAEIEQLTDAPDDLLAHLISVTKTIGLAQRAAWGAPRAAVLVAGFEIPHLHVHVVPRSKGDGLRGFFWPRTTYAPGEGEDYAARLREALGGNTPAAGRLEHS